MGPAPLSPDASTRSAIARSSYSATTPLGWAPAALTSRSAYGGRCLLVPQPVRRLSVAASRADSSPPDQDFSACGRFAAEAVLVWSSPFRPQSSLGASGCRLPRSGSGSPVWRRPGSSGATDSTSTPPRSACPWPHGCASASVLVSCRRSPNWPRGCPRCRSAIASPGRTAACSRCTPRRSRPWRTCSTGSCYTARQSAPSSSPPRFRSAFRHRADRCPRHDRYLALGIGNADAPSAGSPT